MSTRSTTRSAISRRTLLASGSIVAGAAVVPFSAVSAGAAEPTDAFAVLRGRYRDLLLGTIFDIDDPSIAAGVAHAETAAAMARAKLVTGPGRDRVFTDVPFTTSASIYTTYDRLRQMAIAHRLPPTDSFGDDQLLTEILDGLATTEDLIYHAGADEFDNWWHWEIGGAVNLADVLVLLDGLVPAADLDRYVAALDWFVGDPAWQFERYPNRTDHESSATNRVDLCRNTFLIGMLGESEDHIALAADRLGAAFAYATERDSPPGLYPDGSFLYQGQVPYTGSYGIDMMTGLTRLLGVLAETPWQITDPRVDRIIDAVDRAFIPVVFGGAVMDAVRGRAIARAGASSYASGNSLIEAVLRLAPAAEPSTAARWRAVCAGWLERNTVLSIFAGASLSRISLVKELLDDPSVTPADEGVGFAIFPSMARAVHRGAGWACMIAGASDRVAVYDYQLGENYRGFHTAAGWMQLHTAADPTQFTDGYWPTANLYGLPGTTVDTQELAPGSGGGSAGRTLAPNTWAGGVALDDGTGTFGQDLHGVGSTMTARQSWFCLPDRIVALGAGITGGSGEPIVTTIEDRNLHSDGGGVLTVNGTAWSTETEWVEDFGPGSWAHLESVAGYVLLDDRVSLRAATTSRTGTWRQVDDDGSTDAVTRQWLTLSLDHGRADNPHQGVVDTNSGEPDFSQVGIWTETPRYPGYAGGTVLGGSPNHAGDSWVIWRPEVETAGRYEVAVWFPAAANNAPSAPYTVSHADGEDVVVLDQRTGAGQWQVLGEYEFAAGRAEIRMDIDGSGHPKADAVRISEVGHTPVELDSSYAYLVLPTATSAQTEAAAGDPGVSIVANTASVQAISGDSGAVTLANFFAAGSVRRVTADGPCAVALRSEDGTAKLAVSDPTGRRDLIRLELLLGGVQRVGRADETVSHTRSGATMVVEIDTSDRDGRTHHAEIRR